MDARERTGQIDGLETFWREAEPRGELPVVYVHGVPTSSDVWVDLLRRTGGYAPDMPGFGRSAKLGGFDATIDGYASWLGAYVDALRLERFALCVHDWGAGFGLALAQRRPEAVARLVVCDGVPLLPGYRWHRIARAWRMPLVGELAMGFSVRPVFRRALRAATQAPKQPAWRALVDSSYRHLDQGTMRTILRLYRSAPPERLAAAGARLGELRCPALVVWGAADPYLDTSFAHRYAEALGGEARVEVVEGAGHWPWIDRPEAAEAIAAFLLGR